MSARTFAGEIEPGDLLLSGQVLSLSTGHGGFRAVVLDRDRLVADVADAYEGDRVMVRATSGEVYDLHRARVIRVGAA